MEKDRKKEQLFAEIESVFDKDHGFAGHGTNIVTAEKTFKDGIRVNRGYTFDNIAIGLTGLSHSEIFDLINNWPHKNLKAIVIISVPDKKGFYKDKDLVGEIYDKKLKKTRHCIPKEYIKGYFDVEKGIFVKNPNWNSNPPLIKDIEGMTRRKIKASIYPFPDSDAKSTKPPDLIDSNDIF